MENRRRPTSNSGIARGLGGRSGFSGEERGDDRPARGHYEDQDRVRIARLLPSTELVIALAVVLVFVGGFAALIAYLALTR